MRYKAKVCIINSELERYKNAINNLALSYSARKKLLSDEVAQAKSSGMYSDDYIKGLESKQARTDDLKSSMQSERAKSKARIDEQIGKLEKALDAYFSAPVSPEFATKVQSISALGLKLTNSEFENLQRSAHSYMELRLLNQLAETRTKTKEGADREEVIKSIQENSFGKGSVLPSQKELPNAYGGIAVPNIDEIYKSFREYRSAIDTLLNGYCGENNLLHSLLEQDYRDNPFIYANSNVYFEHGADCTISKVFDDMNKIIPRSNEPLSAEEKSVIDKLVPYELLANKGMIEGIIDDKPETESLFERDSRYSKYLSQAD